MSVFCLLHNFYSQVASNPIAGERTSMRMTVMATPNSPNRTTSIQRKNP